MYIFLFWGSFFLRSFFCRVGKSKDYIIYHKENQLLKQWVYNINLLQRALTGVDWRGGTCSQLEHCCATRPICLILPTNLCISSNDSRKLSSEVKGASLKWQLLARLDMKYYWFHLSRTCQIIIALNLTLVLDSGFHVVEISRPWSPDSTSRNFPDSGTTLAHVRYIKILIWFRGFRDKIAILTLLHCLAILGRDLSTLRKPNRI